MRPAILTSMLLLAASPALADESRKIPAEQPMPAQAAMQPYEGFSQGSGAIPALPLETQTQGAVAFLNGGIGDEELAQLKAQADAYNLHIMLSAPGGAYISDVHLRLLDAKGAALIDLPDAGPYVYAKLPPASYTLETTNPGEQPQTQTFKAPAKGTYSKHIIYNQ